MENKNYNCLQIPATIWLLCLQISGKVSNVQGIINRLHLCPRVGILYFSVTTCISTSVKLNNI